MEVVHAFSAPVSKRSVTQSSNEDTGNAASVDRTFRGSGRDGAASSYRQSSRAGERNGSLYRMSGRTEVAFLVDRLVDEQQKVLTLEEQIKSLNAELSQARSARTDYTESVMTPSPSNDPLPSMYSSRLPPEAGGEEAISSKLLGMHDAQVTLWSAEEMRTWQTASLPELVLMRKQLLSSLDGVTEAITQRQLASLMSRGTLDDMQRKREPAVYACLHRLFAEAFSLSSADDMRDLHSLAERVSGMDADAFSAALRAMKELTESEGILHSQERLCSFIYMPSSHFSTAWREKYVSSMRKLLMTALINTRRVMLSDMCRMELEVLTRQELFHTALLRAAQGRDVVPRGVGSLPQTWETPANIRCRRGMHRISSAPTTCSSPRNAFVKPVSLRSGSGGTLKPPRHVFDAKSRWNPPRFKPILMQRGDSVRSCLSRDASVASNSRCRDTQMRTPTRRRNAEMMGLPAMYWKPRSPGFSAAGDDSRSSSSRWTPPLLRAPSRGRAAGRVSVAEVQCCKVESVRVTGRALQSSAV